MADMDVDTAPHLSATSHLDEDLIDYDSDADKAHVSFKHADLAPETDYSITAEDTHNGNEYAQPVDETLPSEYLVLEEDEQHDTEHDQQIGVHVEEKAIEVLPEGYEEGLESSNDAQIGSVSHTVTITGDEDLVEQQEHEQATTISPVEHEVQATTDLTAEEHEIGWEQEEEEEKQQEMMPPNAETLRAAEATGNDATLEGHSASNMVNNADGDQTDDVSPAEAREQQSEQVDGGGDGNTHLDVDHATENENGEGDVYSQQESSDDGDHGFPAITVHYKNDEFPFFSLTSEGFFTQLSVLDENLKSLLAGFRAELSNELLAEEDLVFQIDELGLEFAEVSIVFHRINSTEDRVQDC